MAFTRDDSASTEGGIIDELLLGLDMPPECVSSSKRDKFDPEWDFAIPLNVALEHPPFSFHGAVCGDSPVAETSPNSYSLLSGDTPVICFSAITDAEKIAKEHIQEFIASYKKEIPDLLTKKSFSDALAKLWQLMCDESSIELGGRERLRLEREIRALKAEIFQHVFAYRRQMADTRPAPSPLATPLPESLETHAAIDSSQDNCFPKSPRLMSSLDFLDPLLSTYFFPLEQGNGLSAAEILPSSRSCSSSSASSLGLFGSGDAERAEDARGCNALKEVDLSEDTRLTDQVAGDLKRQRLG